MSDGQEDVSSQPLVIVRRRRNTEETHHGGVWKIAYADFMTAMMAFFLVMWLVNAADKKTIIQVAAYFNPMRLTDRFAAPKGLDDITEMESKIAEGKKRMTGSPHPIDEKRAINAEKPTNPNLGQAMDEEAKKLSAAAGGKSDEAQKEEALFDNLGTLLDKLAAEAKARQTVASNSDGRIRDPFDRTERERSPDATTKILEKAAPDAVHPPGEISASANKSRPATDRTVVVSPLAQQQVEAMPPSEAQSREEIKGAKEIDTAKARQAPALVAKPETIEKDVEAKKLADDISSAISKVSSSRPTVEVKATPEGLLISLLDDAKFGMFEVGSAKPRAELVLVMDKIGEVLKAKEGNIVLRGHTDSRAYRNGNYDNWRLSASRAQMAHYMLVRGGIPESRFVAIEGRADRDPKIPSDTGAAQNRRIDILIREETR